MVVAWLERGYTNAPVALRCPKLHMKSRRLRVFVAGAANGGGTTVTDVTDAADAADVCLGIHIGIGVCIHPGCERGSGGGATRRTILPVNLIRHSIRRPPRAAVAP